MPAGGGAVRGHEAAVPAQAWRRGTSGGASDGLLIRRANAWLCLLAAASMAGEAKAHGGLSMEKDYCKLRIGPYFMHFTGYQPERDATREFCEDIPATGATIIVLDFVDGALKDLPVEVRIIRDNGNEADLDRLTLYRLPPKLYPTGSLSLDFKFDEPGNYVGFVSAGGGEQKLIARFPFSVGTSNYARNTLLVTLLAIGLGSAYGVWRWRRASAA